VVTDAGDQVPVFRRLVDVECGRWTIRQIIKPERRPAVELDDDFVTGPVEQGSILERIRDFPGFSGGDNNRIACLLIASGTVLRSNVIVTANISPSRLFY
jgi:hypothetical protein